ncbi:Glycerol-3-phosphate O-acyltransferase 1 [Hondaea fermentalgiana]|uniref:Glycerol-3-phosphate O-acyltransferase 1 n=1 Tax=Hondaea fermentalgiana TaxID=2315210 RepID=A0A2R5GC21_9STRA|nr:Glycerol-3-phosphate O-acyltransferase 1 [Hondaea fermentalgiana]|eukprot:GBG25294.1 Glycerol-3-phosphate O-acyltransferase 1 [Hondaea fermentalgiana]
MAGDGDKGGAEGAEEREWPTPKYAAPARVITSLSNFILGVFFSRVEIVNQEHIPDEGPVILYGNHFNQFVDAMCMMRAAQRPVSFIIAESSMHKPIIGTAAKMLEAVPVIRPQDRAKDGPGRIKHIDLKSRTIKGEDTAFQSIEQGFMITIRHVGQFALEAASSDTEMTFKELPDDEDPDVDAVNNESDGYEYKITPKIKQSEMFEDVHKALDKGGCIGIFPEGGSHDRTELLPFKVGVAIMALGARSRGIPVKLVPVGMNYFGGHILRSKVFVDCGQEIPIPDELVEKYKNKDTRHDACNSLLHDMQQALDFACLTAPDFNTLKALRTARRMYQNKVRLTPAEYVDLNQRFNHAYDIWKDRPDFKAIMYDVFDYLEFCRAQGLTDKQVRDLEPLGSVRTLCKSVFDVFTTVGMAAFVTPIILPGLLLNLPIPLYIRWQLPKEMKKNVETSNVKIKARDVAASKIIVWALKLVPTLHVAYSIAWLVFFKFAWPHFDRDPNTWSYTFISNAKWILPPCFLFFGPFYLFYVCPTLVEKLVRRVRLLPRYFTGIKTFFSSSRRQPAELLRANRDKLVVRIQNFVEEHIDELPDWKQSRVIGKDKVLESRSKSTRKFAEGDLQSSIPTRDSESESEPSALQNEERQLGRLSFASD